MSAQGDRVLAARQRHARELLGEMGSELWPVWAEQYAKVPPITRLAAPIVHAILEASDMAPNYPP